MATTKPQEQNTVPTLDMALIQEICQYLHKLKRASDNLQRQELRSMREYCSHAHELAVMNHNLSDWFEEERSWYRSSAIDAHRARKSDPQQQLFKKLIRALREEVSNQSEDTFNKSQKTTIIQDLKCMSYFEF